MTKLDEYIKKVYNNNALWFTEEVRSSTNINRISNIYSLKNYLNGQHKVLNREDMKYKEQEYIVKKLILENAKTILNFHTTYLVGKPVSLTGSKNLIDKIQDIYNYGNYNNIDFMLVDKINKFGNAYEYIYKDGNRITSKIIDNADSYPIFNNEGEYIGFIEYFVDNSNNTEYYNVYSPDTVKEYNNEDGQLQLIGEYINLTGLPIHYCGISEKDSRYGEGLLSKLIPVLDEIEDLLSKLGDSIYVNSLNPLLLTTGQAIEGTVDADGVGYSVFLENGSDMKYVNATMDYNTIKYYLDTLQSQLNMLAYMPSIIGGNSNIANVSEVSLKLLYQLADVYAMLTERIMRNGFNERFDVIRRLIDMENKDEYINVAFNYSRPQNASELLDNIKKQFDMGAISLQSIVEQSPLTSDVIMELDRLKDNKDINNVAKSEESIEKDTIEIE